MSSTERARLRATHSRRERARLGGCLSDLYSPLRELASPPRAVSICCELISASSFARSHGGSASPGGSLGWESTSGGGRGGRFAGVEAHHRAVPHWIDELARNAAPIDPGRRLVRLVPLQCRDIQERPLPSGMGGAKVDLHGIDILAGAYPVGEQAQHQANQGRSALVGWVGLAQPSVEVRLEPPGVVVAILRVLRKAAHDDGVQRRVDTVADQRGPGRLLALNTLDGEVVLFVGERMVRRQHLVEANAQGEEIRPAVQGSASGLLGAHVGERAPQDSMLGLKLPVTARSHAEVGELHLTRERHEDVRGVQIPVHDAQVASEVVASLVDVLEGPGDLCADADRDRGAERLGCVLSRSDDVRRVVPLDPLHHEVRRALASTVVEYLHDVGVVQTGAETSLVFEEGEHICVVCPTRVNLLDDDVTIEPHWTLETREKDLGHPTGGDAAAQSVLPSRFRLQTFPFAPLVKPGDLVFSTAHCRRGS